jgi:DNA/RNA-binding domain of Phe-tRNA-synthetase-like protein
MPELVFHIDEEILARFPDVAVGGLLVDDLHRVADRLGDAVPRLMEDALTVLRRRGLTLQNLVESPLIRDWRMAIAAGGLKAATFKGSAEQVGRRLLKDGRIGTPLPAVSAYCAISAQHLAPLGGYDLARLPGREVALRFARPGLDRYRPLSGKAADLPITGRVVIYGCDDEVLCYSWNVRDSASTCLGPATTSAAFFGEAVTPGQRVAMRAALGDLADLLRCLGARVGDTAIAAARHPRFYLTV